MHVVTAWLGNSPKIAMKHYLIVTDMDFEKALQNPVHEVRIALQNTVQQGRAPVAQSGFESPRNDGRSCPTRPSAARCASVPANAGIISGGHGIRTHNPLRGI
jgi:hypothetical protein